MCDMRAKKNNRMVIPEAIPIIHRVIIIFEFIVTVCYGKKQWVNSVIVSGHHCVYVHCNVHGVIGVVVIYLWHNSVPTLCNAVEIYARILGKIGKYSYGETALRVCNITTPVPATFVAPFGIPRSVEFTTGLKIMIML